MDVLERFLNYVSYDTQSDETTGATPSTAKQLLLADRLKAELEKMGASDVRRDEHGYVYARIPATPDRVHEPAMGLISHMDTAGEESGANIKPRVVTYEGSAIVLNKKEKIVLSAEDFPSLNRYLGQELVVTDGTTLLGADDKAGVAEIMQTAAVLLAHPEISHGELCIAFTPDEEIGEGTRFFDLEGFGAEYAYTVDGGELGEVEYENFNAASARVTIRGRSIHPGCAKNKMINAILVANDFVYMLPSAETPAHTEGYEGFFHLSDIKGTVSKVEMHLLVRDHDRASFERRKALLLSIGEYLNTRYGERCVEVKVWDCYHNMGDIIRQNMHLIDRARVAYQAAGVEPVEVPIRGGTDGARLSFLGLPCPNLSTGGVNFHGVYEYISVQSMERMVDVLVNLVRGERS